MGRNKKLGNEICPIHQSLCYYRPHNRRIAKSENIRYAQHYTIVHNDRTIAEHYVRTKLLPDHYIKDNLNKKQPSEIDAIERVRYAFNRIEKVFKTFPHNEEDTKMLTSAVFRVAERLKELKDIRFIYHTKWKFDSSNLP